MTIFGTKLPLISNVPNGRLCQQLTFGDHQGDLWEKAKTGPFADWQLWQRGYWKAVVQITRSRSKRRHDPQFTPPAVIAQIAHQP